MLLKIPFNEIKMKPIRVEMDINASAEKVWSVIMDMERYPEWNRFTPRITLKNQDVAVGAEFDLDCQMTPTQLLKNEHEVVLGLDSENYKFGMGTSRTKGRPGIKSFRWQICEPIDENHTHFINYEEFHGILSPTVYFLFHRKLKTAFKNYCLALKERAEAL